jgi:4-oxalocrotonate tautomerase
MPVINVSMISGRPADTKAALIRELTDVTERVLGVPRQAVRVILHEAPAENWGFGGEPPKKG